MNINYSNIIELLNSESDKIIEELQINSVPELVHKKTDIDNAIKWLEKGMSHQINPNWEITVIPEKTTNTPSSEYRLMEDQESEERKYWTEVDFNKLRPAAGDFIIMK